MRSKRLLPVLLMLVLVVGACASEKTGEVSGGVGVDLGEARGGPQGKNDKRPSSKKSKKSDGAPSEEGTKPQGSGGGSRTEEGAEDDGSSAFAPAAGTYTYAQSGHEEFCDASSCERKELPPTQDVVTTHERRSENEVVVVTQADSSTSRSTTTTTRYSRAGALITNVKVRFNYEGFRFDNSYQPDPPVESLRYPLRAGSRWTGRWEDSTSGSYTISVGESTSVRVGSMTVQAFPVRARTTFEGEFDGEADVITWIDPATAAVVKLEGEIDVKSVFGRYSSEFTANLRSGPGY